MEYLSDPAIQYRPIRSLERLFIIKLDDYKSLTDKEIQIVNNVFKTEMEMFTISIGRKNALGEKLLNLSPT